MNAECGACEDKMRLARLAKEQNLDAVHVPYTRWPRTKLVMDLVSRVFYNRYFKA